ncbi:MAG: hypothetical protein K940chlam5_01310 [Candidatus Anoxychlamydiales bacterium]|nr:hypothetical protein [Candidatus Anoxychlamydiales bacterium]
MSIQSLPDETLLHIFKVGVQNNILDIEDLQNIFLVSKKWLAVAKIDILWKIIAFQIIKFVDLSKGSTKGLEIGIDLSEPKDVDVWKRFKMRVEDIVKNSKNKDKYIKSFNIANITAIKKLEEKPQVSKQCNIFSYSSGFGNYNYYFEKRGVAGMIGPVCMGNSEGSY